MAAIICNGRVCFGGVSGAFALPLYSSLPRQVPGTAQVRAGGELVAGHAILLAVPHLHPGRERLEVGPEPVAH